MRHPSLELIQWQDLRELKPTETLYNLLLSAPFLLLSWWSAWQGWWLLALTATFFFFTAALRQAHDCYHRSLGVNKVATELMLFMLSITMLCSTHAIRHTHLNHHRDPLGESDVEGNWARLPWYQAILGGGKFSVATQWFGLTHSSRRNRLLVAIDMLLIIAVMATAFITKHPILIYHVLIMLVANALVGFFAVWSVHHGCDEMVYARSERQPLINLLTFNLLYHIEHHLFPAVPTNHLPTLAKRLDVLAPQWTKQPVVTLTSSQAKVTSNPNHPSITMYYDDACILCSTEAYKMQSRNPQGINLMPVEKGVDKLSAAGFSRADALTYLCVQDNNGHWYTHMNAVRKLYQTSGIKWAPLLFLPMIKQLGDFAYPYVARNRYRIPNWITRLIYGKALKQACANGACKIAPAKR